MSGFVIWMTGLSGAGKSTLASLLSQELAERGAHVECLDGDEVRKNLSHGLGFSREDRDRNIRRIGYVARMLARSGACAITAAISPYKALRDEIRSKSENFFEVYCECPLDVLTNRDPKGLYKRALAGEIKNFTGVDDPYEAPVDPEVHVRTDRDTPEECVAQIITALEKKGLLSQALRGASSLPAPFGGEVFQARVGSQEDFEGLRKVEVSEELSEEIIAVGRGYYSPVQGFMTEREAVKVGKSQALERGTPWWHGAFLLPLPAGEAAAEPGEMVALEHAGAFVGRMQSEQTWTDTDGTQYLSGPLDAVSSLASAYPSARDLRRDAGANNWERIAVVFVEGKPTVNSRLQLETARALTDCVVVAGHQSQLIHWQEELVSSPELRFVRLPASFPIQEARARAVIQRGLGAASGVVAATD